MYVNSARRKSFSNIKTKGLKNAKLITSDMIVKREVTSETQKKDGSIEQKYKHVLNKEYWQNIKEPINVILDEAHTMLNARRSMSKTNEILTQWLALIRRVLGSSDSGYGTLTLISQLPNRLDLIAREMATKVKWHLCHYVKTCKKCSYGWRETSDTPEQLWHCGRCGNHHIQKHSHVIEVWHFANMSLYMQFKDYSAKTYHKHYFITDIEKYFPMYNTLQWDGLFDDLY